MAAFAEVNATWTALFSSFVRVLVKVSMASRTAVWSTVGAVEPEVGALAVGGEPDGGDGGGDGELGLVLA